MSEKELNEIVKNSPTDKELTFPKKWIAMRMGTNVVYVGDDSHVVAFSDQVCGCSDEMDCVANRVQNNITNYLVNEGFLGEEWTYIGLQKIQE